MTTKPRTSFTSFAESTQEDWDLIIPGVMDTQDMVADNVLEQLGRLRHDHGGYPVDRLEHSLQTATRAQRDGRDDEYVLCALVHDIGDTLRRSTTLRSPPPWSNRLPPGQPLDGRAPRIFQGYYFWQYIGLDQHAREAYRDSGVLRVHGGVLRQVRPDGLRRRLPVRADGALRAVVRSFFAAPRH